MRPTTGTMLQQNNNNNYPCLNVSGSTRDMLQKCSRASLPFPSRLELGLGDLPLIRGLRAWALCSKNRHKAGSLLGGGGRAPTAPPAGRGSSPSCPRPADVYLSEEWGRMGYGIPLGLDARQAGIGALVTVATLKTSEGSGKTQTQCLFLRTEKGSCLYSTAKPGSGVASGAASSVVGGWLRGKTGGGGGGGGGRDAPAGRRDNGPTPPAEAGANRVRVRSGRRWRKSGHAAGREKTGVSGERRQRSGEDPAAGNTEEERQEERDKGGPDCKQPPSPQQDSRRPRCCHNASPKACSQCGRRAQRRESQDDHEGGESPRNGVPNRLSGEAKGMRKERQKNEEEEEEEEGAEGGLCKSHSSDSVLVQPNPDLESNRDSHSGRDAGEGLKTSHGEDDGSEKHEDTNPDVMKIHSDFTDGRSELEADDFKSRRDDAWEEVNGFPDCAAGDRGSEKATECLDVKDEGETTVQGPADASGRCEDVSVLSVSAAVSSTAINESSVPVEGSTSDQEQENIQKNHHEGHQRGFMGEEEQEEDVCNLVADENNTVNNKLNEKPQFLLKNDENHSKSSPLRHREASISEEINRIGAESSSDCRTPESEESGELQPEEETSSPAEGTSTCNQLHDGQSDAPQEDNYTGVKRSCAPGEEEEDWRLQADDGDTSGQTSIAHSEPNGEASTGVTNIACADPPTPPTFSPANPAPSLPPLESMATGLPCLEAEREEEEEEEVEEEEEDMVRATAGAGEGGQEEKRRNRRELEEEEEEEEEERGSIVATEDGTKEEEEEEDEFGVFMQAEGEPAWSEGFTVSASVPCGSRESVALGNGEESAHCTSDWMDSSFHQSDDSWTAFPQDSPDEGRDLVEQWWPTSAVEERRDRISTNQNLASVFTQAFPSIPASSSSDPCDLSTVPTLTQVLRGAASQDQGLLDSFHDLNKMIGQRYKRASGVSRDLLLKTLHLEQPHTESRPAPWAATRRLSPGLPSANQHAQNAAAKRRLSYDYNRNIME